MSEVKVNKISPRTNCGTVQLGDSGDTITIPAGVSITNSGTASGFGATGAVSWNTTVKTSGFTAVAGEGYFVNTTGGAMSVNLPAGTAGAVVGFKDYANTFDSNAVTLVQNGSDKIGGSTVNATLSTEGLAVTLVFIDSTQGWLVTDSGLQDEVPTAQYVTATGGTITTSGDFKIHTFTGPGTFTVCSTGNPFGSNTVSYMVVAGGASGGLGDALGAGGGAGGFRESKAATDSYTASPLNATSGPTYNLPVSAQGYPIVVGAGGSAPSTGSPSKPGNSGSNSSFSTITSAGGGAGGGWPDVSGTNGGSGGGSGNSGNTKGDGNTPPVSPPQGNDGGNRHSGGCGVGGGGGATAVGRTAQCGNSSGGNGATTSINGTPTTFAGGGGGGASFPTKAGGTGGGGAGGYPGAGTAGTANTGGGGGGNGPVSSSAGAGGSGIVIIRYKFQ
jgi:hypothetical protein